MTKKIILDVLKKSKWSVILSVIILAYLYGEVNKMVFAYLCFLQIWFIHVNIINQYQKEINAASENWVTVASEKIKEIINNISEFRKIYDDLIAYIKDDKDIH